MTEPVDHFADYVADDGLSTIGETIDAQREKTQKFLASQESRLDGIESHLTSELDRISGCLEQWRTTFQEVEGYQKSAIDERRQADEAVARVEELQLKTQRQRRELAEKFASRRTAERGKTADTIARLQGKVKQLEQELNQADLASLEAKMKSLGEQLADELARAKRLESDARSARDELLEARSESSNLRQQVSRGRALLDERADQINSLRTELDKLTTESGDSDKAVHDELERLRAERRQLQERLVEMEAAPKAAPDGELEDLRCKYEMAVENVRSLKSRNEELERELSETDPADVTGGFDWEAKKRELMSGEGDAPAAEDSKVAEKLAKTVKMTDRVIAQKDKKIAELEARFERLRTEHEKRAEAEKPVAPAKELPVDAQAELERLKNELRDKLRAAEVDISVERAQNARVRAELEEKMRDLDAQLALAKKQASVRTGEKAAKGWFRR